jgi:hypothetical protein
MNESTIQVAYDSSRTEGEITFRQTRLRLKATPEINRFTQKRMMPDADELDPEARF